MAVETFRVGEYIRANFGDDIMALPSQAAQDEFEKLFSDYVAGRSSRTAMRDWLMAHGVPASQIQRTLNGERLTTWEYGARRKGYKFVR